MIKVCPWNLILKRRLETYQELRNISTTLKTQLLWFLKVSVSQKPLQGIFPSHILNRLLLRVTTSSYMGVQENTCAWVSSGVQSRWSGITRWKRHFSRRGIGCSSTYIQRDDIWDQSTVGSSQYHKWLQWTDSTVSIQPSLRSPPWKPRHPEKLNTARA